MTLKGQPIIAFIATQTPSRAKTFYAGTLGLRLLSEDDFALVFDAGGTMLRVATVKQVQPASYTVLGWSVPNIRRAIQTLVGRGVTFRRYESLAQDDEGVWAAPSGAKVAWFEDPDGNTLSLTQFEQTRPPRTPRSSRSPRSRRRRARRTRAA